MTAKFNVKIMAGMEKVLKANTPVINIPSAIIKCTNVKCPGHTIKILSTEKWSVLHDCENGIHQIRLKTTIRMESKLAATVGGKPKNRE